MAYQYHAHPHWGYGPPLCTNSGCSHSPSCPLSQHFHPAQYPAFDPGQTLYPGANTSRDRDTKPVPGPAPSDGGLLKNIPCLFFRKNRCSQGDNCRFSHTASDLPDSTTPSLPCKFFRRGSCKNGESCVFVHGGASSSGGHEQPSDISPGTVQVPEGDSNEEPQCIARPPTEQRSPHEIPLPPSPRASTVSALAPVFEPCTFQTTGICVRGDLCVVPHCQPIGPLYSPIPSVSPLIPGLNGDNGDWIQFSEEAITQASNWDLLSPSFAQQDCSPGDDFRHDPFHNSSPIQVRALVPCKYFPTGKCTRGDVCPFVHDIRAQALAPPTPELTADNAREPRLCRFQGTCRKGNKCSFRHTLDKGLGQGWPQPDNPSTADREATQEKSTNWALDTDHNSAWGPDLQETSKWIVDPPNADWEATSWGPDTDQNPAWGLDQQVASKSEEAGAGEQSTNWALDIDHNPAWGPDEQAASKWIQEAPDDTECAESGQVCESSGTGWLQETDDNPAWNIDPQVEDKWTVDAPAKDSEAEESWNLPWPSAVSVPDVKPRKNGYCKFFGQGWCAKGDECELLHVQDRSLERDPDEGRDQDPPEPNVPAPEGPCFPPQSIYHCMVQFGPGAIPQKIVSPFESLSLTISNYPAGIAHADLVELAEPYGVVKNTTFRLHPTEGGVHARIEFEECSQAAKARANLNGFLLDEQVLHVQLDSVAPVRGSVHETGIACQVKLVWEAPSVSGWAFYSNVRAAKDESVRLNGILYGPRKITAEYRKSNQKLSFPVRLTGLPVDTNRDDLHAFCAGSSSVSLNPPNYTQSQDENILRCLADCGPVDFDVLPTDPSDLKITGFAQFHTDQAAASAVKALKGTPHDFLGKASISLQPVFRSKYACANCPFTVIRNDLDLLRDACSAPASGCTVRYYEHPPYVHVYGGKADTVAQIAKCVQVLVFGVDLTCWHPYFETRPAEEALRRLNSDGSFYIQSDKRRQVLRIWGNRDAGEKQIHRLLKRVEAKRHSLRLDGTMPALLNGGLRSLQDEYGASKILLDIRLQTIIALGDIKTEVESHLKAFAAAHSPGTGNCCLCSSAAEDFVELPCTHIYCASCFQHLLRPIPGINFSPPTCLAETHSPNLPTARCLAPIPIPSILSHLSDEEQTQLFEASFLSFVRSQSDYRFCISGCLVIYRIGIPGTIFSCPECGVDLCASCAVPVHTGLSCAEYHALGGSTESE